MSLNLSRQTVLITGASSGIGRAFALALAQRGAQVVLVARRVDRLDALARQIEADHGVAAIAVAADLTRPESAAELRTELDRRGITVTSLINNAGFGTWGPFTDEDLARVEEEVALDVSAPVRLTHVFLPSILAADTGFVINLASMAAYQPTPRMAVYGAAKAFVLSFTEALWAELRHTGVTVFALSPGATATEFNQVVGTDDATSGARMRTPEAVVATAFAHLAKRAPGPSVADGRVNRTAAALTRLTSRRVAVTLMDRLTDPARREQRRATA